MVASDTKKSEPVGSIRSVIGVCVTDWYPHNGQTIVFV